MRLIGVCVLVCLVSCKKLTTREISGVWQMKNLNHPIKQYHELIISATSYSVFSERGLNYTADYELTQNGIMKQYIKDIEVLNSGYLDTLEFHVSIRNDSLILSNILDSEYQSSWVRIQNARVLNVVNSSQDYHKYAMNFKDRYKKSMLREESDSLKQSALDYFDRDWNTKKQTAE